MNGKIVFLPEGESVQKLHEIIDALSKENELLRAKINNQRALIVEAVARDSNQRLGLVKSGELEVANYVLNAAAQAPQSQCVVRSI